MEKIECPYCGYDGGPEYGTNMPFIDNLGVLKMDCAKCTRRFNVKLKLSDADNLEMMKLCRHAVKKSVHKDRDSDIIN